MAASKNTFILGPGEGPKAMRICHPLCDFSSALKIQCKKLPYHCYTLDGTFFHSIHICAVEMQIHFCNCLKYISSVGSQNLITLIFTKTTFCQRGNTKRMAHILSNSRSSRPIRTPLKSIIHASQYCILERYHYFGANFAEIQCFAMKKMLKMS